MNRSLFLLLSLMITSTGFTKPMKLTSAFAPEPGRNGYMGQITFNYVFKSCYQEVTVAIVSNMKVTPTKFLYKGKEYLPGDFGKSTFGSIKLGAVSRLFADVFSGASRLGKMTMKNVTDFGGNGCFGQTYAVKDQIANFNNDVYKKKMETLVLRNPQVQAYSSAPELESIIKKKEWEAKQKAREEKRAQEKAKKEEEKAAAAAATQSSEIKKGVSNSSNQIMSKNTSSNKTATNKATSTSKTTQNLQPQKSATQTYNEVQKKVDQSVQSADNQSKQIAKAGATLATAGAGMWDQGMGLGIGMGGQSENNSSYLEICFGSWDFPTKTNAPGKFWSGAFAYAAFELGTAYEPLPGNTPKPEEKKHTTQIIGVNILNDSMGWHIIRPSFGLTWNFVDEFDNNGNVNDEVKTEFGVDLGLSMVGPGFLFSWTYNTAAKTNGFRLIWQKD